MQKIALLSLLGNLVLLYWPTFEKLASYIWPQEQYSHGALVIPIFIWLVWRQRHIIFVRSQTIYTWRGAAFIGLAITLLVIGRLSTVIMFEALSLVLMLSGIVMFCFGKYALRGALFPLTVLSFLIPLPGIVMYLLTATLKEWNAYLAVELLYHVGFPVALEGVIITIGGYQLFLADACAGVNSLYALILLGLVFIHLSRDRAQSRKLLLTLALVPIALFSNFVRVISILLITYYNNAELADQFHDLIGLSIFCTTLLTLLWTEHRYLGAPQLGEQYAYPARS